MLTCVSEESGTVDVPTRVPPLVLISGPEELLAERALAAIRDDLRVTAPDVEMITLEATAYEEGELALHASPSLFGEDKAVVVRGLHEAPDHLQQDLLAYLEDPADEVTLVVVHASGNRGKKVLDTMKKAGARVVDAPAIKSDRDKTQFTANEFRAARRRATPEAVQALVEAVGKDVRELASACQQLVDDTTGTIDADVVERYHGGRVEATGFKVAEAAFTGQRAEALRLVRHAMIGGLDPVPIVAVMAGQARQIGLVASAGNRGSAQVAGVACDQPRSTGSRPNARSVGWPSAERHGCSRAATVAASGLR